MTAITTFQCDLCLTNTTKGITLEFKRSKDVTYSYYCEKSTGSLINVIPEKEAMVKHICPHCTKHIKALYRGEE